jgi:hypothetical protein
MLTFPKNRYDHFASKLRQLREKCNEEADYTNEFDSILEEQFTKPELIEHIMTHNHTVDEFYDVLKQIAPRYMSLVNKYYHLHGTKHEQTSQDHVQPWRTDSRYWTDPLSTPLPNVTNLKIYCSKTILFAYVRTRSCENSVDVNCRCIRIRMNRIESFIDIEETRNEENENPVNRNSMISIDEIY